MQNAYLRLIRFDKPIGTLLLLWPTLWALWFAYLGLPPITVLLTFCAGVFLTRSAGCAINDSADADFDGKVKRTSTRPLVTREISKKQALLLAMALSLFAFVLAVRFLKFKTIVWAFPALFLFATYPFFKRFFLLPQAYLAIAYSFGILMAFIEAQSKLPLSAYLVFSANFFWVIAYDTIYALVDIDDDLKIGIKTSAITFGDKVISVIMSCYAIFMGLLLAIGLYKHMGWIYFLTLGGECCLIYRIYHKIKTKDRENCFKTFLFNNYIGLLLFLGIAANYAVKGYFR